MKRNSNVLRHKALPTRRGVPGRKPTGRARRSAKREGAAAVARSQAQRLQRLLEERRAKDVAVKAAQAEADRLQSARHRVSREPDVPIWNYPYWRVDW